MPCRYVTRFFIEQKTPQRGVFFAFSAGRRIMSANAAVLPMQGNRSRDAAALALYIKLRLTALPPIEW
jgi:hypothetical protein